MEQEKILADNRIAWELISKYTNSSHSSISNKQPNPKMSRRPKQTFLQRRNVYLGFQPIFQLGCLFFVVELYELFIYFGN